MQLTDLVGGDGAVPPFAYGGGAAFFRVDGADGDSSADELVRLSLADYTLESVQTAANEQNNWVVSADGSRILHTHWTNMTDGAVEVIDIEGGVIGEPLPIQIATTKIAAKMTSTGRFACFIGPNLTPTNYPVYISDLDGPSPEVPQIVGGTNLYLVLTDDWLVWITSWGGVMVVDLAADISPQMLADLGSAADQLMFDFEGRSLFYRAPDGNHWVVDFSGDQPGSPTKFTQGGPGISVGSTVQPSPIDDRAIYRLYSTGESYAAWESDPWSGNADVELFATDRLLGVYLFSPGRTVVGLPF